MIDIDDFLKRITTIAMQFDLAFEAIAGFRGSEEALRVYANKELDDLRKMIGEAAKKSDIDLNQHWVFTEAGAEKYITGLKEEIDPRLEEVGNRLRQNKIVMLMAVFEATMKDIHREVLRAKPSLLRPDRGIPLGRLIATSKEEILDEEIEREVHALDRKNIEDRAKYFDERLNLDWFGGTIVPVARISCDLRNNILHTDPDVVVSDFDVNTTYLVAFSLPTVCIIQGALLYPDHFSSKGGDLDGFRALLRKQGRL